MCLVLSIVVGGGKDVQNLMIVWNTKKRKEG